MGKKINSMMTQRSLMDNIVSELKKDKEASMKAVKGIQDSQEAFIRKIRTTDMSREEMSRTTNQMMTTMDSILAELNNKLKAQKSAEEQERLRKIQEQMEKERKQKEEEERK